jgi:hypothetical protein
MTRDDAMTDDSRRVCDCGKAIRGLVPEEGIDLPTGVTIEVPAHFCLQCSPEHCKMRKYVVDFCTRNGAL